MVIIKLYFHFICIIKKLIYKLLYGSKFHFSWDLSFRKGFCLAIFGEGEVKIARNVFFNNYSSVSAMNYISVGEGTIFGENVRLYDHNHIYLNPDLPIKQQGYTSAPIYIGKHCWIGSNVTILKGVTIGDGSIVGYRATVTKSLPESNCLIVGFPAKVVQNNVDWGKYRPELEKSIKQ